MQTKAVTIIGSGISGLTTAAVLQEAGYVVHIVTKDLPLQTTSVKAAAVWFPFHVHPIQKAIRWSIRSYEVYQRLSTIVDTGVIMEEFTSLMMNDTIPEWIDAMPKGTFRKAQQEELPTGYKYGYTTTVPIIDAPIHLSYLFNQFKENGGTFEVRSIDNLKAFAKNKVVINCTGLASKTLLNDTELYPIRGQLAHIKKQEGIKNISDDFGPNALSYIIHRSNSIVLGGTLEPSEALEEANPTTVNGIINRCQQIEPNLKAVEVLKIDAGLRPARSSVRLERDGNLLHNYGHGGGGYTVSWGCAYEVLNLLGEQSL